MTRPCSEVANCYRPISQPEDGKKDVNEADCDHAEESSSAEARFKGRFVCSLLVLHRAPVLSKYKWFMQDEEENRVGGSARLIQQRWSSQEHALLESLVNRFGADRKWAAIASHMEGRTGKQCRERFLNHIK